MNEATVQPENNAQTFTSAAKFEIELPNGRTSQLVTIFNSNEINFENLVAYTKCALAEKNPQKILSVKASLGSIRSGVFKAIFTYNKTTL